MLRDTQVPYVVAPPQLEWPVASDPSLGSAGLTGQQIQAFDRHVAEREGLIADFHEWDPLGGGLGRELSPGILLAFRSRDHHVKPAQHRSREVAWRRANQAMLRALEGQWVVIEAEQLIAHGDDPGRLVAEVRTKGVQVPYIFFVEPSSEGTFKLGL